MKGRFTDVAFETKFVNTIIKQIVVSQAVKYLFIVCIGIDSIEELLSIQLVKCCVT